MSVRSNFSIPVLPHIESVNGYTPGLQPEGEGWLKLNTNESPFPPSPKVAQAIDSEISKLSLYPNPQSLPLREAIAKFHSLEASQVIAGNGSDDLLNMLVRCFSGPGKPAGMMVPSYSLYPVLTAIQGAEMIEVFFDREMVLDSSEVTASGTNIFFLTSPNSPTGIIVPNAQIREVLRHYRGILVVDEAYSEFADESALPLVKEFENLVIVRTLSKSHALAGLRVGYAITSRGIIDYMDRIRDSYNVNRLSQAGALAALSDVEYYESTIRKIRRTRENCFREFRKMGWFTYPSQSNYLFTEPVGRSGGRGKEVAEGLYEYLLKRRILVRHFGSNKLTEGFLRISVGSEGDMVRFFEAVNQWLKNEELK